MWHEGELENDYVMGSIKRNGHYVKGGKWK